MMNFLKHYALLYLSITTLGIKLDISRSVNGYLDIMPC